MAKKPQLKKYGSGSPKKKATKKITTKKRVRTVQVSLNYQFTPEERANYSDQLASEIQAKNQLDDEKKEAVSNYKAKIDACTSNINKLANWVNSGQDYRSVPVIVKKDYEKGIKEYFHPEDLKRKLGQDKMIAADYQTQLFEEDHAKGKGAKKLSTKSTTGTKVEEPKS